MRRDYKNLGYRTRYKEGYFPVPPADHYQNLRSEMVLKMISIGMDVECQHHEVATAGQAEIDLRFNTLLNSADNMMKYKYIIKNTAAQAGKTVTFMPKPIFSDNGSGMHTHQSLWLGGKPLFAGDGYAGLSQMALWYAGGLLKHARALSAFIAPGTNSYKRLVPGYEAPVNLAYSRRNRSAAVRIPVYSESPKAKRLEFRPPDPSCNPYLAFSAMLMAGLDGIKHKIDPGQPLDKDIFELDAEEAAKIPSMPGSLEEALGELSKDHKFLLEGGVFTEDFVELWINYKKKNGSGSRPDAPASLRVPPLLRHLRVRRGSSSRGSNATEGSDRYLRAIRKRPRPSRRGRFFAPPPEPVPSGTKDRSPPRKRWGRGEEKKEAPEGRHIPSPTHT